MVSWFFYILSSVAWNIFQEASQAKSEIDWIVFFLGTFKIPKHITSGFRKVVLAFCLELA